MSTQYPCCDHCLKEVVDGQTICKASGRSQAHYAPCPVCQDRKKAS